MSLAYYLGFWYLSECFSNVSDEHPSFLDGSPHSLPVSMNQINPHFSKTI